MLSLAGGVPEWAVQGHHPKGGMRHGHRLVGGATCHDAAGLMTSMAGYEQRAVEPWGRSGPEPNDGPRPGPALHWASPNTQPVLVRSAAIKVAIGHRPVDR